MSSPIQKALTELSYKIPQDILQAAFIQKDFGRYNRPINLNTRIREEVIEKRVMVDCNLNGGQEVDIPLATITPEHIDPYTAIYRIPKDLTQNRCISRVTCLTIGTGSVMGTTNMGLQGYSQLLDAAAQVFASQAAIPIVSTAYVTLIAENTILVADNMALPTSVHLRCYLEYDQEMEQLKSTSYHKFVRLVELAVKSYIYNKLAIPMGRGELSGGLELGRFKEIVDGYADAEDLYQEYLQDTWRVVALLSDFTSNKRHLRLLMSSR